ncbi:MAG: V-type ATP synthase subunit A [Actinophytocola sp.]|uniref:V-type ATP synthase subunit A n=1 Tax=Actinophytocola sp. TaxID=1872138 RepID=UPI0013239DFA|nr:V-type ATP synthase subunit A [Actinophytocola sp.]MPZ83614.1 V-type ATP synthase subunit A [Actinophytocola sp.]
MTATPALDRRLDGPLDADRAAPTGEIWRIAGPVVVARGLDRVRLYNVVRVGRAALPGEVIRLDGDLATIQVYESTSGLRVGEPVLDTGRPLEVELGPGLLGRIFDGTQRPLEVLARVGEDPFGRPLLPRGASMPSLDRERAWTFEASVAPGDRVVAGDVLGVVAETKALRHRILVPPHIRGVVTNVSSGPRTVAEPVVWIDEVPVTMLTRWPVRDPRPVAARLAASTPLITGQRAIDVLFPIARGGAATIPGGFGTGKTVLQQSLAKWARADVVVYVGCGERGNELAEVLQEFPELIDPRTGASLMERTILIANTSNMPVAAREASIYTGVTVAEYFRDQGYHVALMADSTSRWGEALREVSSRLEEMPAEEGYPAYLSSRLAEFYERGAAVRCAGSDGREGPVTIIGAVSPAGGDFSEPITQHSLRLAGTFWALETSLARARHFPAIDWNRSYTLYDLTGWFEREVAADWAEHRAWAGQLLQRETQLLEVVQLVGADTLAPPERVLLRTGRLLREDFLQQSAFDEEDAYCDPPKQIAMLRAIRAADAAMTTAVDRGVPVESAAAAPSVTELALMRRWPADEAEQRARALVDRIRTELENLG